MIEFGRANDTMNYHTTCEGFQADDIGKEEQKSIPCSFESFCLYFCCDDDNPYSITDEDTLKTMYTAYLERCKND